MLDILLSNKLFQLILAFSTLLGGIAAYKQLFGSKTKILADSMKGKENSLNNKKQQEVKNFTYCVDCEGKISRNTSVCNICHSTLPFDHNVAIARFKEHFYQVEKQLKVCNKCLLCFFTLALFAAPIIFWFVFFFSEEIEEFKEVVGASLIISIMIMAYGGFSGLSDESTDKYNDEMLKESSIALHYFLLIKRGDYKNSGLISYIKKFTNDHQISRLSTIDFLKYNSKNTWSIFLSSIVVFILFYIFPAVYLLFDINYIAEYVGGLLAFSLLVYFIINASTQFCSPATWKFEKYCQTLITELRSDKKSDKIEAEELSNLAVKGGVLYNK